ncbi:MAG: TlpA disulfide reductase family protein [Bacteroidales bacterium]
MTRYLFIFLALLSVNLSAQSPRTVPLVNFMQLEDRLKVQDDTLRVFNFWATWCKPCVYELPYFLEAAEKYKDQKFQLLLVSLDFPRQIESRLIPFLEKNQIKVPVVVLDARDPNSWIDKVDEQWSGAIPATLFVRGDRRYFHEAEMSCDELNLMINKFLNY